MKVDSRRLARNTRPAFAFGGSPVVWATLGVVFASLAAPSGCKEKPAAAEAADAANPATTEVDGGNAGTTQAPADVTSGASTTWTEGPSVVTKGSVDAAALRVRTRARLAADSAPVHLLEGGTARELGQRACEAAVPKRPADTKILIKPNLGGFEWFKDPEKSGGDDGLGGSGDAVGC